MFLIHILLIALLGTSHMAQSGADQHQGQVPARESTHHASAAADFLVESLNDIVGSGLSPMLGWKFTLSQPFLDDDPCASRGQHLLYINVF